MNFPAGLFPVEFEWVAWIPLALVLFWCLRTAPWKRLLDSGQSHVWAGTIVVLALVWSLNAGVKPGLNLPLLGATAFTLMFGRQLAMAGFLAVLAAVTANGSAAWEAFALNALVMAVFPCFAAHAILKAVEKWLPANFFIYIFVAAFFGAAVTVSATGLLSTLALLLVGAYPAADLFTDYFPYFVLLGFAEAWLNGAAITLMVVYYPHWVGTFDDRRYLFRK